MIQKMEEVAGSQEASSGTRCLSYNRKFGSEDTSSHIPGWAVDVRVKDNHHRWQIITAAILAGFNRIEANAGFENYRCLNPKCRRKGAFRPWVHLDCDPAKPKETIF